MHRRVTANMDQRFPDATPEDLERSDNICIICREEMTDASRNKKLACNHVFHLHCLRCGDTESAAASHCTHILFVNMHSTLAVCDCMVGASKCSW